MRLACAIGDDVTEFQLALRVPKCVIVIGAGHRWIRSQPFVQLEATEGRVARVRSDPLHELDGNRSPGVAPTTLNARHPSGFHHPRSADIRVS